MQARACVRACVRVRAGVCVYKSACLRGYVPAHMCAYASVRECDLAGASSEQVRACKCAFEHVRVRACLHARTKSKRVHAYLERACACVRTLSMRDRAFLRARS